MPVAKIRIPVPKFRPSEVALAELCATELWNGRSYENGNELEVSDEELLVTFASATHTMVKNGSRTPTFTELDIRLLIRVAKLKALFRSAQPTDFQGGISAYKNKVIPYYLNWKNKKASRPDYEYATKATLMWSEEFVNNTTSVSVNGNHRIPLTCRILFFSCPDMPVFNYSNGLGKVMKYQSRPQDAISHFNEHMYKGLQTNKRLFSKLDMPAPILLGEGIWLEAKKADWWQRRVLDLALLLRFSVTSATPQLHTKARQVVASGRFV